MHTVARSYRSLRRCRHVHTLPWARPWIEAPHRWCSDLRVASDPHTSRATQAPVAAAHGR
eukprot:8891778-Pyramimonas_sp.AAC.1